MKIFTSKDRLINHLYYPISFLSFILIILFFVSLLPNVSIDTNLITSFLWSALCGGLIAFKELNSTKRSAILCVSTLLSNLAAFSICQRPFGLAFSIIVGLILFYATKNLDLEYQLIVSVLLATLIGVLLGFSNNYLLEFVRFIARKIKGNGVAFGVINEAYSSLFSDYFSRLFYNTDFGGSTILNNDIVSGAVDIFNESKKEPLSFASTFLTGKYFANVFLPLGVFFALYSKVKDKYFYAFVLSVILAVICGNNALLLLFIFFYNPLMYMGYLLITGLCYFVTKIIDIRLGFNNSASIIEMLIYPNKMLYFILVGLVSSVLMYYVIQIILSKFDMDNQKYYPREVRNLLKSLGGERNIEGLEQGILYVKNPNLIDILKVDCDIHQNEVSLITNDYDLLKEYF